MGLRTGVKQLGWVPIAVLLVLLWTIVSAVNILGMTQSYAGGEFVGRAFLGGAAGLIVLFGFGVAVAYLFSTMGETEPAPESFPPR